MPLRRPRHSAEDTAPAELVPVIPATGLEHIPPTIALPLVPGLGGQPPAWAGPAEPAVPGARPAGDAPARAARAPEPRSAPRAVPRPGQNPAGRRVPPRFGPRRGTRAAVRPRAGFWPAHAPRVPARRLRPEGARTIARTIARTAGEILVTAAAVALLLAGYEVWGRTGLIGAQQNRLDSQLARTWDDPTTSAGPVPAAPTADEPLPGSAIGRLYIPRLHLRWVVVEGVAARQIRYSPGHYPGTALPGEVGNFSVAGHREPGMFWDLDRVRPGDTLVVETRSYWYLYRVYQDQIVAPQAVEVVAPVPGRPGQRPTDRALTLTTCSPKWDDTQRLVLHAVLTSTLPHDNRPAQVWS